MADQIRSYSVTVPAETPQTAPLESDLSFPGGDVERIDIRIPPGHAGLTGFQLAQGHQAVIPINDGEFIVGDQESFSWPIDGFIDSGDWQFIAYNVDRFEHTFYVRLLIQVVQTVLVTIPGPVPFTAPDAGPTFSGGSGVPEVELPDFPDEPVGEEPDTDGELPSDDRPLRPLPPPDTGDPRKFPHGTTDEPGPFVQTPPITGPER